MSKRNSTIRAKTPSDMAAYNVSPGNFWEIGNYTRCCKRITDSNNLCDDLIKMYTERAEIEAKYSKKLTDWHERWSKHLEASPAVYATMKTAHLGTLKEAHDRAIIHMDCWTKIHNQVVETIKREKESKYHKAFVGIKEYKELDEEFGKAQKPWATAFGKVQRAKKNYHSACKSRDSAKLNLDQNKDVAPPEKIKKLEEAIEKQEKSVSTMQGKYEEKLSRIEPINKSYEDEMKKVYSKFSKAEEERKDFLQRIMVEFHKAVNVSEDPRLKECFENQINAAYAGKSSYDVTWYSENYGADMARNWPKFEELGDLPDLPAPVRAVEPPENQRFSSNSSIPRSGSSQFQQQTNTLYEPASQQSVVPVQSQQVASYQPNNEPEESNPFMNGDDDDDVDGDEWDNPPPLPAEGVPVRALYDYDKVEEDELSFKANDILTKLSEEDEQGWCRGRLDGVEGLYPANYVELM